jgi:predicted DCC family thiol-disulfide oxidoreductase YuxK
VATVPGDRALLLFDGYCGVCTRLARFVVRRIQPAVDVVPAQTVDLARYGITEVQAAAALQHVDESGRVTSGAAAVAQLLRRGRRPWRVAGMVMAAPGVIGVAEAVYRLVARNRHRLPGTTPACRLPDPTRFAA